MVKSPPANAADSRDLGSIPGLGRSPGGGNGNPRPSSCLENPTDRGAWRATVQGVVKSWTQLHSHASHSNFQWKIKRYWKQDFSLTAILGKACCPPPRSRACSDTHCPLYSGVSPFWPSQRCPGPRPASTSWSRVLLTSSLDL